MAVAWAAPLTPEQQAIARQAQEAGATHVVVVDVPPAAGPVTMPIYTVPEWVGPVDLQVRDWQVGTGPEAVIFMAAPVPSPSEPVLPPGVAFLPTGSGPLAGVTTLTADSPEALTRLTPTALYAVAVRQALAGQVLPIVTATGLEEGKRVAVFLKFA